MRGNAGEGVRTRGHPDRVHHRTSDDRPDGGGEPHPARRVDHPSDGRSVARHGRRARPARRDRPPRARDADGRGRARHGVGARGDERHHDEPRSRTPRSCSSTCPTWFGTARSRAASRRSSTRCKRALAHLRRRGRLRAEPGVHRQPAARGSVGSAAQLVGTPGRRRVVGWHDRRDHAAGRLLRAAGRGRSLRPRAARRTEPTPAPCRCTTATRRRRSSSATTTSTSRSARRCCSRTSRSRRAGSHALRDLLTRSGIDPASITHAIGCGEEAVGDRYQRGGGNMAKAIAEECGLARASAIDVKSFCAAPGARDGDRSRVDRSGHRGTRRSSSRAARSASSA